MTWALWELTRNIDIQEKLRKELQTIDNEHPSVDELAALPYLDKFIRELLRMYPAIAVSNKLALDDSVVPLETPFVDQNGHSRYELHIKKGQTVFLPIHVINRLEEYWGPDATKFNPDRWDNIPEAALQMPTVWGNTLSFLGGPRNCIGYRFALVEIRYILFVILRNFEMTLAIDPKEIVKRAWIVQKPVQINDPELSNTLPIDIRPIST
jgi:cytochrome P450